MRPIGLILFLILTLVCANAFAAILSVPHSYPTINIALNDAKNGDTVMVGPGYYSEHLDFSYGRPTVTLMSEDGPAQTALIPFTPATPLIRFYEYANNKSRIIGFTLKNSSGAPAVRIEEGNRPFFVNCTFENNNYSAGPAIYAHSDEIQVIGCSFRNNTASLKGGAVFFDSDHGGLHYCVFYNNVSSDGGGAVCIVESVGFEVNHCLFYENDTYDDWGGALYAEYCDSLSIINNTVVYNENINPAYGAGMALVLTNNSKLINNIVAFNEGGSGVFVSNGTVGNSAEYNDSYGNSGNQYSGITPGPGSLTVDPLFTNPASHNYSLQSGSPCINSGNPLEMYDDADGSIGDMGYLSFSGVDFSIARGFDYGEALIAGNVASLNPRISWEAYGNGLSEQVQYDIEVGTDQDWDVAEMWDTGPVRSSVQAAEYGGSPLSNNETYYSRIRIDKGQGMGRWNYFSFHIRLCEILEVPEKYATIHDAIIASNPGDTILVGPGVYDDYIIYPDYRLNIISTGGPDSTFLTFTGKRNIEADLEQWSTAELVKDSDYDTLDVGFERDFFLITAIGTSHGSSFEGFTVTGGISSTFVMAFSGYTRDFLIHNNRFIDVDTYDIIRSNDGVGVNVVRNLFASHTEGNVMVATGPYCRFINNTVVDGWRGLAMYGTDCDILNNIVMNLDQYDIWNPHQSTEVDYNDFWNNGNMWGSGFNGISADPLFFSSHGGNYSIMPNSPCLDAGHPDPVYNDPDGSRNDIGAYHADFILPIALDMNLGTEVFTNVVDHNPEFQWTYYDEGGFQSAYQIQVGIDNEWTIAELWDSGEIYTTEESANYGGGVLEDGMSYFYRIRLYSGIQWGTWRAGFFRMNSVSQPPQGISPLGQLAMHLQGVRLWVANALDSDGDTLTYDFEVYADESLTIPVFEHYGATEGIDSTSSDLVQNLGADAEYWWRARTHDGFEYSEWSATYRFETRGTGIVNVPGDFQSIGQAINNVGPGDTILAAPGTYHENIIFGDIDIVLMSGEGPAGTVLSPLLKNLPTVQIINGNGPETKLIGFTVTGADSNTVMAIFIENSSPSVIHNIIRDNDPQEEVLYCSNSAAEIKHNLFYGNGGTGCVGLYGNENAYIVNNTFYMNSRGILSFDETGVVINNIVMNSSEYGLYGDYTVQDFNDVYANASNYAGGASEGASSISEDPRFVDAAGLDYSLTSISPCINAGSPDIQYIDPDGTRNDIGAYFFPHQLPTASGLAFANQDITHVIDHTPSIHWEYFDNTGFQTAYEIEIGTDNDWIVAEMWATGQVISTEQNTVYAGLPLEDAADYYLRIRLSNESDWGGWNTIIFHMNNIPTVPHPNYPVDSIDLFCEGVALEIFNSQDLERDPLKYDFVVYEEQELLNIVYEEYQVPGQSSTTTSSVLPTFTESGDYWWIARSYDGFEYSEWSEPEVFTIRLASTINVPGDYGTIAEALIAAESGDTIMVDAGTYPVNLIMPGRNIILRSRYGPEYTVLTPSAAYSPVIRFPNGNNRNTEIVGFTFSGAGGDLPNVIEINQSSPTIKGNVFVDNDQSGYVIYCVYSAASIERNLFYGNNGIACVKLDGATADLLIANNTFHMNQGGISTTYLYGIAFNNIITESVQFGLKGPFAFQDYNDVYNNFVDYQNGAVAGDNNISMDPLYIDPVNGDFTLMVNSPCIDAGHPDPLYNDPDGSRSDMGSYSISSSLPVPLHVNFGEGGVYHHLLDNIPTFYWDYYDTSGSQAAYEIEIGTDNNWDTAEMWAPGAVYSADHYVGYDGEPLLDGTSYMYRLRVYSGQVWGSWIYGTIHMNYAPTRPLTRYPSYGQLIDIFSVYLETYNSTDIDGDLKSYFFELFADEALQIKIDSVYGLAEQISEFTRTPAISDLADNAEYWWRVRTFDGYEYSDWSIVQQFSTRQVQDIYVPEDYSSIQQAVDEAANGDRIYVSPGVYTENISFNGKILKLISTEGPLFTTIRPGVAGGTVSIVGGKNPYAELTGFSIVDGNLNDALYISNASPKISNNIFRRNGNTISVMRLWNSSAYIHNNLFIENTSTVCLAISGQSIDARVINNTFDRNGISILSGFSNAIVVNNIITNSSNEGMTGVMAYEDYNNVWNNYVDYGYELTPGYYDLSVNPMYTDTAALDYSLDEYSPCIDAGHPNAEYNDPDGSRNDMGAFPFNARALSYFELKQIDGSINGITYDLMPALKWSESVDIDSGDVVTYTLYLSDDEGFTSIEVFNGISDTSLSLDDSLEYGSDYWWKVKATSAHGHSRFSGNTGVIKVWKLGDVNADWADNAQDIVFLVNYKFKNGPAPVPLYSGDIDGNCIINILDIIYHVNYKFKGGPYPLVGCE